MGKRKKKKRISHRFSTVLNALSPAVSSHHINAKCELYRSVLGGENWCSPGH
jgi:hypothetical protein